MAAQIGPVVDRHIDDGKAGGRKFFGQAVEIVLVSILGQKQCQFLQPGIVTDDKQALARCRCLADRVQNVVRVRLIDALIETGFRSSGQGGRHKLPGLSCPPRRRDENTIRDQGALRQIGANLRRCRPPTRGEIAVMVALAVLRSVGFCVAKQHEAAHERDL